MTLSPKVRGNLARAAIKIHEAGQIENPERKSRQAYAEYLAQKSHKDALSFEEWVCGGRHVAGLRCVKCGALKTGTRSKLHPENLPEILSLLKTLSFDAVGARFGMRGGGIYYFLQKQGIDPKTKRPFLSSNRTDPE